MENENKKSLLQKYNIPLHHLDFAYVEKCTNGREMEKIVQILRSGEEGFYPDLLRCSEEKLKELKPDSRLFRYEEQIKHSNVLDKNELKPILDWTEAVKSKDSALSELKKSQQKLDLPSVRKPSKIDLEKQKTETPKPAAKTPTPSKARIKDDRIKSTDYRKWDKYDPDEEILRMDLDEERSKEQAEQRASSQRKLSTEDELKNEKASLYKRLQTQLKNLSQVEREQYAERHRLKGNECFKAKEFDNAIEEYNCAILYDPQNAVHAYNNRAAAHIKLKKYFSAIADCQACLQLDPKNVKAHFRMAEALNAEGKHLESLSMYQKVLELEPENVTAKKSVEKLTSLLGEVAPASATRLKIEELDPPELKTAESKKQLAKTASTPPPKDYDLAELIKPNRMAKSKLVSAAEALGNKLQAPKGGAPQKPPLPPTPQESMLRLPQDNLNTGNKLLIQEI
ncbi:sperm-associated antigen 1 isoform X1 [Drosophila biarmipes]|uniref:sperm-associated antigen 1 isoform X1 n=1 Tax=Drosophila biarmipes TaxID=125945 RepID=UPI0007E73E78|nr:sperm-associated antigen 1 isoform X1 [Drosophila biarmipes]